MVGFQHPRSARNFLQLCEELLRLTINAGSVGAGDRKVAVDAFPISIDLEPIERMVRKPRIRQRARQLRAELRLTGHLNASYGTMGHPVVHYTNRFLDFEEILAMYVAADVMMVTSLSDGMNLVSKEYVASRADNRGTLVLSEFTGAAAELGQAIVVNPNDIDDLKDAILQAVAMNPAEQRTRMQAMRAHLRVHDARAWINSFLIHLA